MNFSALAEILAVPAVLALLFLELLVLIPWLRKRRGSASASEPKEVRPRLTYQRDEHNFP